MLWDALGKKIYNYSFEQALRYGTVCDFVIFQVVLSFLPEEQEEYDMLTEEMRVVNSQLYQGYPLLREFGLSFFPVLKSLAEDKFHYLDYERRMNHLLKSWDVEKLGDSYRKEAAYCLSRGMLRADWMLGEDRIKELLLTAVTEREKNYWICMREMNREFRDDSNA